MSDITELSIAELAQRFRDKSLSPVEATHAYLARISKFNDRVNAFVLLREEDALAEAREAEAEIAAGNWEEAERSGEAAGNARRLDSGQGRRRRALLFHQRAVAADRAGRAGQAADLARKALGLAPGFVPAALLSARLAIGSGRLRHARKAIERCWAAAPHPALARAYLDTLETADPRRAISRSPRRRWARNCGAPRASI